MPKAVYLATPLCKADIEALRIDDVVYISGELYTMMYDEHFTRLIGMIDKGEPLPMELRGAATYHTGTIFVKNTDGSYDLRAIGTTTSSKFNLYAPEFIRKSGIRAIMGKGGMNKATLDAMRECGCVYLALAGGCSAAYTEKVVSLDEEYWPEAHKSWADNMLKLSVKNYGPLFVSMDAHGHSIYEDTQQTIVGCKKKIYEVLSIGK